MRSYKAAILLLVVALGIGNIAVTLHRSAIPPALRGRISSIQSRFEKHPGVDTVHLVTVRGETMQVDEYLALRLDEGDRVEKPAWATEIEVNGEPVALHTSRDFERMLVAVPAIVAVM
ncbi:MAG: hypothetical protein ACRDJ5_05450, partial [Actinomycetota bacterium]